jgi:hypothetical protein
MDEILNPETAIEQTPPKEDSVTARVLRFLFFMTLVVVFIVGIATFCWCMFLREFLFAGTSLAIALVSIPFVTDEPLRIRIAASFVMLFAVLGLFLGGIAYFCMFHFKWWDAIFNNKGSGPLGLIFFAFIFSAAGFYCGFRLVRLTGFTRNCRHQ